jgi:hypothetical protein
MDTTTRLMELPPDNSEYNRLILRFARIVLAKYPKAWCGVVTSGPRINTWFVWLEDENGKGNLSEGASGPLTAWYEASEVCR